MKAWERVAALGLIGALSACATVVRGSNTDWSVQTSPVGAAVATSNGRGCPSTPCFIRMPRKSEFTATITKPGYRTASIAVTHDLSAAGAMGFAGNLLIGGLIGMGVDYVSGAALDLSPRVATFQLEREAGAASLIAYTPEAPPRREGPAPTWPTPSNFGAPPRDRDPWSTGSTDRMRTVRVPTQQGMAVIETYDLYGADSPG